MPRSRRRSSMWSSSCAARSGLTPAIGSSSRISRGSAIRTRAKSRSLRCPPESVPASASAWCRAGRARSSSSRLARAPRARAPGTRPGARRAAETLARRGGRGEQDVLEHGHPRERARRLERPHEPGAGDPVRRPPVDLAGRRSATVPRVRPEKPGDEVEQGGLAGAVRPDQRRDRACLDVEARRRRRRARRRSCARRSRDLQQRQSFEHHLLALARRGPAGGTTSARSIASPITISRRYARSAESKYEKGGKSKKRVPAKRKPKTTAPTGTAHDTPMPPRMRIIQAKKVSERLEVVGAEERELPGVEEPGEAAEGAPSASACSL